MADLATFASGIVHDIRNPLNVIRTNLYLLRQRVSSEDPRAHRAIERIDDQVTVALRMLEGIQAFYRSDSPSLQRVQVNEVVRTVLETTLPPEGIELTSDLAEDLPLVDADAQLLDSALRALIRNGVEAVAGEGRIRVTTAAGEGGVRVTVEDSGPGIPEDVLPRVREPFFTTRRSRSGLGLTVADKVAQAHGGRLTVESRAGEGTRVELELPAGE